MIQRRDDYGEPRENFNKDWSDYKNGFGDPAKEFWLGNENIYMLTNNEEHMLRVELEDFEGNKRQVSETISISTGFSLFWEKNHILISQNQGQKPVSIFQFTKYK